jgi:DNA-binding transcriptional ArsR family regulator
MTSVDLLLHPVRLRIVQTFLGNRELTTAQLAEELSDIPKSGLYRHLALLSEADVLTVVGERQVRGTVERTYALRLENARVQAEDLASMTREDHAQAFATFVAGLLSSYDRYLSTGEPDLVRDGVSYSMSALWLSDEEHLEFLRDLAAVVAPRANFGPSAQRRRRLAANVFMPLPEPSNESETNND